MPSPTMVRPPPPAIAPLRRSSEAVASTVRVVPASRVAELARVRRPLAEAARTPSPVVRRTDVPRAVSKFETVRRPALRRREPLKVLAAASVRLLSLDLWRMPAPPIVPSRATSAAWLMFRFEVTVRAVRARDAALAVTATVPVLVPPPMVTAPAPVRALPLRVRTVNGLAARVAAPARTIGRAGSRVKLALATRAPPLKVSAPVVAPRLASAPTTRLPPLRKVPPE